MTSKKENRLTNSDIELLAKKIVAALNGNDTYREIELVDANFTTQALEERLNKVIHCGPPQRPIKIQDYDISSTSLAIEDVVIFAERRLGKIVLVVNALPLGQVAFSPPGIKSRSCSHGMEVPPSSFTPALKGIELDQLINTEETVPEVLQGQKLDAGTNLFPRLSSLKVARTI